MIIVKWVELLNKFREIGRRRLHVYDSAYIILSFWFGLKGNELFLEQENFPTY